MGKSRFGYLVWYILLIAFASCNNGGKSCMPVREAQQVISQADSLWQAGKMYGVDEGDSATLAQAYEALKEHSADCRSFSEVFPFIDCTSSFRTYAHACYHYGKLLRAKDDPIAAMQAFIDATHSRTHDYHILGRVYSNVGDLCHRAGDYQLSYDMFEQSANMFLKDKDTLSYYYCLNDMAFELAEQGKKEETLELLYIIEDNTADPLILAKVCETKTELYFKTQQYDSAYYYSTLLFNDGNDTQSFYVLKAQALVKMGLIDSALYYAGMILNNPTSSVHDKYNMLYIVSHYKSDNSTEDILHQTSIRADLGMIIDNQHAKHAQAAIILHEALKFNKQRIYAPIIGLIVILTLIGYVLFYVKRNRKIAQEAQLLAGRSKELNEQQDKQYKNRLLQIQENCAILAGSDNFLDSIQWKNYDKFCESINIHFFLFADKLKALGCLNEKEIRLCVLVLIGSFTDKQMADILYYSHNTIRSTKRNLALKLGTTSANLHSFLTEKAAK